VVRKRRLRVPHDAAGVVTPAVEAQLNDRQKKIMLEVQQSGFVTSGWCRQTFEVTYDTANRDLIDLAKRGLVVREGRGRSTRYKLKTPQLNLPM